MLSVRSFGQCIGSGAFGQVFFALLTNGQIGVTKVPNQAAAVDEATKEAAILNRLCHKNILRIIATVDGGVPVFAYCEGGDLECVNILTKMEWQRYASGIAAALEHCHARRVLHRDVKLSNIFLSDQDAILGDFGCAEMLDEEGYVYGVIGSIIGIAPEVVKCRCCSTPSDVWSWGATFIDLRGRVAGGIDDYIKDEILPKALRPDPAARLNAGALANLLNQHVPAQGQYDEDSEKFARTLRNLKKVQEWACEAFGIRKPTADQPRGEQKAKDPEPKEIERAHEIKIRDLEQQVVSARKALEEEQFQHSNTKARLSSAECRIAELEEALRSALGPDHSTMEAVSSCKSSESPELDKDKVARTSKGNLKGREAFERPEKDEAEASCVLLGRVGG